MKKEPISIERDFDSFIICYVSIAVLMDVYQAHFLLVRPGISPKMQKNQSDLTRKKKNQSFC